MARVYIPNPNDITAIQYHDKGMHIYTKEGSMLNIHQEKKDFDGLIKKLNMNFIVLDYHASYNQQILVNPKAVSFITQSKSKNNKDNLIIGVQGFGNIERIDIPVAENKKIIDTVTSARDMIHYPHTEANARWVEPKALYLSAQDTTDIKLSHGFNQIDVYFDGNLRLDVQAYTDQDAMIEAFKAAGEYTDYNMHKVLNEMGKPENRQKAYELGLKIAKTIADKNPNLSCIDTPNQHTIYTTPSRIKAIAQFENEGNKIYGFYFQSPSNKNETITIRFNDSAAAEKSFDTFVKKVMTKKPPQRPNTKFSKN